jgi:CDP-paratose 2-epimerase
MHHKPDPDDFARDRRPVMVTGGSGFVGINLADRLCRGGDRVLIFDDLSRPGVDRNLAWLRAEHGDRVEVEISDVRDADAVRRAVTRSKAVFHFAAQVAVTTSLVDAVHDFEVNARGTLNVLEAARHQLTPPPVIFTSTNKVYGELADLGTRLRGQRYEPVDEGVRVRGIGEDRCLDFHSPYGCSKGAADQYVLDYARTFKLPACVFRMSCIYGPHQCGNEDQGWVAHFLIQAIRGEPLTIYGDGNQVRDICFADDLVDAFLVARRKIHQLSGHAFNIGGGVGNVISLRDLLDLIEQLHGKRPDVRFADWRTGDQRYYVSDTSKFTRMTGWTATVSAERGITRLYRWLADNVRSGPKPGVGTKATSFRHTSGDLSMPSNFTTQGAR